jgi:hypothetical protein
VFEADVGEIGGIIIISGLSWIMRGLIVFLIINIILFLYEKKIIENYLI